MVINISWRPVTKSLFILLLKMHVWHYILKIIYKKARDWLAKIFNRPISLTMQQARKRSSWSFAPQPYHARRQSPRHSNMYVWHYILKIIYKKARDWLAKIFNLPISLTMQQARNTFILELRSTAISRQKTEPQTLKDMRPDRPQCRFELCGVNKTLCTWRMSYSDFPVVHLLF
jgi:hypothetical protein